MFSPKAGGAGLAQDAASGRASMSAMTPRALGGLVLVWLMGYARASLAGCPNTCDIAVDPVVVSPELACMNVDATDSTCDCGVHLVITNSCTSALEARDFTFLTCGAPYQDRRGSCTTVAAGENGVMEVKASADGRHQWNLTLRSDGVDHVIGLKANVSSFDEPGSCGCPFVTGSLRREQHGARFALVGIPLLWLVRRQRRGP